MRKIISIFIFFFLSTFCFSSISNTTTDVLPELINKNIKSIVSVKSVLVKGLFEFSEIHLGTGWVSPEGYIITCAHVISPGSIVTITGFDNKEQVVKSYILDNDLDIAILQVEHEYPPLKFGNFEDLKVGERIWVLGGPPFINFSAIDGIVSFLKRYLGFYPGTRIQTTIPITPGFSGSPVFNMQGEVIGMAQAYLPDRRGIHFVIGIDYIKKSIFEILK